MACALVMAGAPAGATVAQTLGDGIPAPITTLSPDGRVATDGTRTLAVSRARGVEPGGEAIRVDGLGYDEEKGIYLAFCVVPPPNAPPTPCGGGVDLDGASESSVWISSHPPSYGRGLAVPYGPGGSFGVTLAISAAINASIDCRVIQCAIVSRNDHTRSSDRSQDVFVPISFAPATSGQVASSLEVVS
jgi:hypothetical protein